MMTLRESFGQALKTSIRDPYDDLLSFDIDSNEVTLLRLQGDLLRDEVMFENLLNTLRADLPTCSLHVSLQPPNDNDYDVDQRFARIKGALQNVEGMQIARVPYPKNDSSTGNPLLKVVLGICGAVAAPFIVPGIMSLIGFTTAGIVAGTPAAWIMSLYGGAVPSGSACAIMQGIGAARLGTAGTTLASTVGGVVAAEAGARVLTRKSNDEEEPRPHL